MKPGLFHKAYWNSYTLLHARHEAKLPFRPLAKILAAQTRRVRAIVRHAYETVPYYREVIDDLRLAPRDFRNAEDLALLPVLTGKQLALEPARFLSRRYMNGRSLQIKSSGTSGYARPIFYDPAALFLALAHGHRQRLVLANFVGRKFGYREMSFIRPENVSVQIRRFYESHSWAPGRIDLERDFGSLADSFEDSIARLNALRPDVVRGYGSHLGALFRHARERGVSIHRPRAITYGADSMAESDRRLIETEFGVPVLSTYQATEALRIGFQCERRGPFHLNLDDVAIRIVDDNGNPVKPGERGTLMVSNLTNRATVLLNYKLGDLVTLSAEPCGCERTLPTIERIDGRADDYVVLTGGRKIHAVIVLPALLWVPGVIQVQLTQEELNRFSLRVVCAASAEWSTVSRELHAALRSTLGDGLVLDASRTDSIPPEPNGKFRSVISHVRQ
jgi:phenylacetate-CoA ligase